jgi:hypothetical protein
MVAPRRQKPLIDVATDLCSVEMLGDNTPSAGTSVVIALDGVNSYPASRTCAGCRVQWGRAQVLRRTSWRKSWRGSVTQAKLEIEPLARLREHCYADAGLGASVAGAWHALSRIRWQNYRSSSRSFWKNSDFQPSIARRSFSFYLQRRDMPDVARSEKVEEDNGADWFALSSV